MNTTQANPIQTQHVSAKSKIQFPTPFETMEQRRRRPPTQPQPQLQLPLHSEEAASLLREALFRLEAEEGPQAQALGGGSRYGASGVIGIRGGGRGGGGAFSSDDDGAKTDDDDDDDSTSSSASASSSLSPAAAAVAGHEFGMAIGAGAVTDDYDASASSAGEMSLPAAAARVLPPRRGKAGRRHERRSRGEPGGGGGSSAAAALGAPPSVLIPLDPAAGTGGQDRGLGGGAAESQVRAAAVPAALLPLGAAAGDAASVCRSCLALSDKLLAGDCPVVVLLLRSGRFAGAVYRAGRCVAHRTCARYTTRRGQGGAQSAQDGSKGKAKSMGAQLRRAGEAQLRKDVADALAEWRGHVDAAALVLLSCPKTMRRGLHEEGDTARFLPRDDGRIRRVPLDVGRPTYESAAAVYETMLRITVRDATEPERRVMEGATLDLSTAPEQEGGETSGTAEAGAEAEAAGGSSPAAGRERERRQRANERAEVSLTPLHEAVAAADIFRLTELLRLDDGDIDHTVDARAGESLQTPLHLAAALPDSELAAECVAALLLVGRANPCVVDDRNRPPYFVSGSDRAREAFRTARAELGEDHCDWDAGAKVPSPLSQADVQRKKEKAAEKKRKQRARQKEKKAQQRAEEEARVRLEREEQEQMKAEEDARRERAGLRPKTTTASNACDFCQKVCKGKRRSQMFSRLEYVYCGTDCVKKHQRELTAAAAMARLGG